MGEGYVARVRSGRPRVLNVALRTFALLVVVFAGPLVLLAAIEALLREPHTTTRLECTECDPLTTLTVPTTEAVPVSETVPGETVPAGGAQTPTAAPTTTTIPPEPVATFVGRPRARDGDAFSFKVASVESGEWTDVDPVTATGIVLAPWREYRVEVVLPAGEVDPVVGRARTRGLVMPTGVTALRVLPLYDMLALLTAPLLLASVAYLFFENRRRNRAEVMLGVPITLVPRRSKRRRRPPTQPASP